MKKKSRGNRGVTLAIVFICVALAFAILWGIVTGIEKLMHYGENATIQTEPVDEPEQIEPEIPVVPEEEPLPKNLYNADGFYEVDGVRYYHGGDYEGVPGIDVSSYQSDIDWEAVKASGIEFAIIRVGYRGYKSGELDLDNCFVEHMEGALAAGLEVGVYFFSQALTPEEAAATEYTLISPPKSSGWKLMDIILTSLFVYRNSRSKPFANMGSISKVARSPTEHFTSVTSRIVSLAPMPPRIFTFWLPIFTRRFLAAHRRRHMAPRPVLRSKVTP